MLLNNVLLLSDSEQLNRLLLEKGRRVDPEYALLNFFLTEFNLGVSFRFRRRAHDTVRQTAIQLIPIPYVWISCGSNERRILLGFLVLHVRAFLIPSRVSPGPKTSSECVRPALTRRSPSHQGSHCFRLCLHRSRVFVRLSFPIFSYCSLALQGLAALIP